MPVKKETSMELDEREYPENNNPYSLSGLAGYCYDVYNEYSHSSYRIDKLKEIGDGRKRLSRELPTKTFPWEGCSNKTMGLEAIAVDSLAPRMFSQIIGEENFINAEPVGEEDVEGVEGVERFAQWMITNSIQFPKIGKPIIDDLLIDGTVDIIPVWTELPEKYKKRETYQALITQDGREIDPQAIGDPQIIQSMVQQGFLTPTMKDRISDEESEDYKVKYEVVNLNRAYFSDAWEDWAETPYIREIYPSLYDLEDLSDENGGPYISEAISADLIMDRPRDTAEDEDPEQERLGIEFSEYSREVKVLEFYIKWKGQWRIVSFAPDSGWRKLRDQAIFDVYPFDRKPVYRIRLYPNSKESMGIGVPKRIIHYSRGIDDLFNIWIDAWTKEVKQQPYITDAPGVSDIDTEIDLSKAFTKIPPQAEISFPPKAQSGIAAHAGGFIEFLLAFFEKDLSLMDHTLSGGQARSGKGTDTASGMSMILQEGNIKHQYAGDRARDQFEQLFTDTLMIYQFNMPLDARMRIFENDEWVFEPVDVMALQGRYDLRLEISDSTANKAMQRNDASQKLQALSGMPGMNVPKLVEDFLKSYGHKSGKDYIAPSFEQAAQILSEAPEAFQALQQFMQQRQQQQEAEQQTEDLTKQAQKNVQRQDIQREVETAAGTEDRKIVDQVSEATKRELYKPAVEQATVENMMNGQR